MTHCLSMPISAGSTIGSMSWNVEAAAFAALLRPRSADLARSAPAPHRGHDEAGRWPPIVVGGLPGMFITVDSLIDQLRLMGLDPDAQSLEAATELRARATSTFGDVELVGLSRAGGRRLYLLRPDGRSVPVRHQLADRSHRPGWGRRDRATVETARLLLGLAWSRRWGPHEEMLAEGLACQFLAEVDGHFSVNANSLCDWCLFDQDLRTSLGPADLERLSAATPPVYDHDLVGGSSN